MGVRPTGVSGESLRSAARAALFRPQPGPPPAWLRDVGGPNAPMTGAGTANATIVLQGGTYVLGCWIPSAAGVPHLMKGMVRRRPP